MSDRLYFSVPDECDNMLAQRFLRDKCGLSARIITRLKREKDGILMDGKILRTIDCVQSGKTVSIAIPDEKCEIEPTKGTLDIRYEDEHFLVVNKPHSMPVHPVSYLPDATSCRKDNKNKCSYNYSIYPDSIYVGRKVKNPRLSFHSNII